MRDLATRGDGWIPLSWVFRSGHFQTTFTTFPSQTVSLASHLYDRATNNLLRRWWLRLGGGPLQTGRRMPLWASFVAVPWVSSKAVQDGCWELGTPGWDQWELHRAKTSILSPSPPNSCRSMAPERPASLKPTARRHCCSRRLQRALAVGSLEPTARRHPGQQRHGDAKSCDSNCDCKCS